MKIDCTITQNFMKEFARMCKYMPDCGKCDMNLIGEYGSVCYEDCMSILQCERYMPDIQKIVQDWSNEHPQLTCLEVLLKQYPNVPLWDDVIPRFCPGMLGMNNAVACNYTTCLECWNQPIQ